MRSVPTHRVFTEGVDAKLGTDMFPVRHGNMAVQTLPHFAKKNDDRITRFGKALRKSRLDELPQFINVLKGEMSIIGPRPEQIEFVKHFEQRIPFYNFRHCVRPGISGWAQTMYGYASDENQTRLKLEYDFFYIKHFSLWIDVVIVIKTIMTLVFSRGAR